ncbi:CHC2 zinc finger domain-containing protein [Streptomyces sp. ISL-11]|uniref:CHC2 zinc finger domain-containing protein n=1 Tax=Streptomyces sp. ISL-11 TaxID=2819174 RepID=UPI0035B3BF2D
MRRSKPPIADVFGYYYPDVKIRGTGEWEKILCPLHSERNPSASVNTQKNKWHCFACALTEDSWDVVQREEGMNFRESADLAAERFGRGGETLRGELRGEPGRTVHRAPRFGGSGQPLQTRLRRFGDNRA